MYQATINPNASSSLPTSPPPFTPPNFAIWVNALWFLSLVISITCALLATLLQQWARRYLKVTQPRYSPHRRARIRAFFAEGVDKFLLPWAVEALPTMLHLSLFLFFAGLAVFLWNVNLTIFKLVLSWIGLCTALYGCITFIPIFRHDSPYHTPLSLPVWHFFKGIPFLTFRALESITLFFDFFSHATYDRFRRLAERHGKLLVQGMRKIAEETAFGSPSEIDTRAFLWTFDSLDEDHELERFFAGLPGFRDSKMVKDPLSDLNPEQQVKILNALIGLSDRTSSSNLLPELVKSRRIVICRNAIGPGDIPYAIWWVFDGIVSKGGSVQSAEIAYVVKGWDNGEGGQTTMTIRAIVSTIVAKARRRDDLWFHLAADDMGVLETDLRTHATHGHNLSLAILIHVVHQEFSLFQEQHWPSHRFSEVLEAASKFDVLDTSPELQHEFCALWNELVRRDDLAIAYYILARIRNVFLTLHLHTDSAPTALSASTDDEDFNPFEPSSYSLCNIPGHHPDSTTQIKDAATPAAIARADLRDDTRLSSTPDAPTPSVHTPVRYNNPMDVPLLENISVPPTPYPAHQISMGNHHDSTTSPELAGAGAARDNPSAETIAPSTRETSSPSSSVLLPAAVSPHNHTELLVHPDASEILSLEPPEPLLDGITGPSPLTTHLLSQSLIAQD
jgi:hypothetical protein